MKNQIEIFIASDHAGFKLKNKILESDYFKDKPKFDCKRFRYSF